jgi:inositol oxygenase
MTFRIYDVNNSVAQFYKENHEKQTLKYVNEMFEKYSIHNTKKYDVIDLLYELSEIEDQSDPDLSLPQIYHAIQTADGLKEKYPENKQIQITGLIHDLGKVLTLEEFGGLPQWSVVGDIFPIGCKFSNKIVYPEFFDNNPDNYSLFGIYKPNCGIRNLKMSFGHDWFLYDVLRDNNVLDNDYRNIIRFHSFYSFHKEDEYKYLSDVYDRDILQPLLCDFSQADLYTKDDTNKFDIDDKMTYYGEIVSEYIGKPLKF